MLSLRAAVISSRRGESGAETVINGKLVVPVKRTSLEHQTKDSEPEVVQAGFGDLTDHIAPVEDKPTLLSDEGLGLKFAGTKPGWHHAFDRKQTTTDIATC